MDRTTRIPQVVRKAGILGIGLDSGEGHTYVTRGDEFMIMGGSEGTHDELRAKVLKFQEAVSLRGKSLLELTEADLDEIIRELE